MKYTTIIALALVMAGCAGDSQTPTAPAPPINLNSGGWTGECNINTIVIDSCEYIVATGPGRTAVCIIHKANCKNPIHNKPTPPSLQPMPRTSTPKALTHREHPPTKQPTHPQPTQ